MFPVSPRKIADRVGMSRKFVNKWTQSKDQDMKKDERGLPKGRRRKWTGKTDEGVGGSDHNISLQKRSQDGDIPRACRLILSPIIRWFQFYPTAPANLVGNLLHKTLTPHRYRFSPTVNNIEDIGETRHRNKPFTLPGALSFDPAWMLCHNVELTGQFYSENSA
jgi:hypothetical protein